MIPVRDGEDYERLLSRRGKKVFFFGSDKCHNCVEVTPFVEIFEMRSGIPVIHVDVGKLEVEGLEVIPVFVGYDGRDLLGMIEGGDIGGVEEMMR